MEVFNVIAGLASIAGLGFTIYAVREVVGLRRLFYVALRGGRALREMRVFTEALLEELNSLQASGGGILKRETISRLKEHESRLEEIAKNLPSADRVGVTKARSKLAAVLQSETLSTKDSAWMAYDELIIAVARLEELVAKYELKA